MAILQGQDLTSLLFLLGVCLLLAYKVNEPKRSSGEFATLMKYMTKHMDVSAKDIKENEFHVFSLLEFNLYLPRQEFLPHFEQILYRQGELIFVRPSGDNCPIYAQ